MASADMNQHRCLEGKKTIIRLYCISLNLQQPKTVIWCVQGPCIPELLNTEKQCLVGILVLCPSPWWHLKPLPPLK